MKVDRLITLDIGPDQIRMGLFARRGSGKIQLLDYDAEPYAARNSGMAREALVATALKRLLDRKRPSASKVAIAVDGSSVFSRLVKLPPVSPDKRAQTIRHEAVQNIPFPIDDVVWDAYLSDPDAEAPEALVVAVKGDLVAGLVHAVEANGLEVEVVDAAPAALANIVRATFPGSPGPLLLVDAGAVACNLVFMDGGRIFFRTLPVGGGMQVRLAQEIERSIAFFCSQQGGNAPQRVLLSGTVDDPDGLAAGLGLPVERLEPLKTFETVGDVAGAEGFGVLAGLAVRDMAPDGFALNLLPEAVAKRRQSRRRLPLLVAGVAVVFLILLAWILGLGYEAGLVRREADETAVRIRALEQIEARMIPLEQRIRVLEEQAETYRGIKRQRTRWLQTMAELENRIPKGMFLLASEPIRVGEPVVGLRVTVVSYLDKEPAGEDAVVRLRDSLRASPLFSDETKVLMRPAKGLFARHFTLDVYLTEPAP